MLSQDEVDALIQMRQRMGQIDTSELDRLEVLATERPKRVSPYNFTRPRLFAQDQMRVLNHLHESFARGLSVYLSAQLRTVVDIKLYATDQVLYSEYVMSSAPPSALYVLRVKELNQEAIFELDPSLAIFIVEKLFGGPGVFLKRSRDVSQIERRIMNKVMDRSFRELEKAWQLIYNMSIEQVAFETNAEFVQIIPGVEPALVVTFEVLIYEKSTLMNICYPYLLLERMLGKLGIKRWMSSVTSQVKPEVRERYESSLRNVDVDIRAELGRARVPVREVMQLDVGDVIPLAKRTSDSVDVYVGSELKFRAAPGKSGKKRALRITAINEPETSIESEDEN